MDSRMKFAESINYRIRRIWNETMNITETNKRNDNNIINRTVWNDQKRFLSVFQLILGIEYILN